MTANKSIMMGAMPEVWMNGKTKSVTFCVTEDCNLACKYCYMTGKNSFVKMDFETARKAVDFVLSSTDEDFDYEGVIWEFIGGEPFLEIDLIDKISDYIKLRMFALNHRWLNCYMFNFSSNGLLYSSSKVQDYIKKNRAHVSIGLSIDGNKIKHDLQRVKKDGSGSYDEVIKNAVLWMQQFTNAVTKATFSHDDLPYLKDSIVSLWDLGLKIVPANVVFEDVWHEGDDVLFEQQLMALADYILEKDIWKDHSVRFFDPRNGFPAKKEDLERNFCGSGKMLAIDCKGNLFPCIRFYDISLSNRKAISIGDVDKGLDKDKIRPFHLLSYKAQSTEECIQCEVATGCAWCTGGNYDTADTDTIFQRATFICKMHKANMRANEYFWNGLSKKLGYMPSERQVYIDEHKKPYDTRYLQFIVSDSVTPHCSYRGRLSGGLAMSMDVMEHGLDFAERNGFIPVFLGEIPTEIRNHREVKNVVEVKEVADGLIGRENEILIFDNAVSITSFELIENCILLINRENIGRAYEFVERLSKKTRRINLRLESIEDWTLGDLKRYEEQLDALTTLMIEKAKNGVPFDLNVLTDIMMLDKLTDCGAGVTSFSLAPNGKIYWCPAFYFDDPESAVGDLEAGIFVKNAQLLDSKNAPLCSTCDAFHCNRCIFLNKKCTNEIHVPSRMQCLISHVERSKSRILQAALGDAIKFRNVITEIDYMDPLEKVLKAQKSLEGCF